MKLEPIIFIDTCAVLDFLLRREGWQHVAKVVQMAESGQIRCCCSYLTIADVAYIARRQYDAEGIRTLLRGLMSWCEVVAPSSMDAYSATRLEHPDFEDSLQILTAEAKGCQLILTNNLRHFEPFTEIPVRTAEAFLAEIAGNNQPSDSLHCA